LLRVIGTTVDQGRVMMEMADAQSHAGTTVSQGRLPLKAWTHLVITIDRRNRRTTYYFDGHRDSSADLPPEFTGNLDVAGHPLSTGTWQPFLGLIQGLRVYRRLLADGEIHAHAQAGQARHRSTAFTVTDDD
jgi:hypothetical protein